VRACVRTCMRACVHACVHVCVCILYSFHFKVCCQTIFSPRQGWTQVQVDSNGKTVHSLGYLQWIVVCHGYRLAMLALVIWQALNLDLHHTYSCKHTNLKLEMWGPNCLLVCILKRCFFQLTSYSLNKIACANYDSKHNPSQSWYYN
jgi:hypothetical protein